MVDETAVFEGSGETAVVSPYLGSIPGPPHKVIALFFSRTSGVRHFSTNCGGAHDIRPLQELSLLLSRKHICKVVLMRKCAGTLHG